MTPPFRISPSAVARYFFHDCERFLRFRATASSNPEVPSQRPDTSPVMEAVLESGTVWEARVVNEILADRAHVAPGDGAITQRFWGVDDALTVLGEARPGEYVYQPTLRAPPSFYARLGLDPDLVYVSDNRPDLLQVMTDEDGGRLLRVIDIKRGSAVRLPYRAQVLFYALQLDEILRGYNGARADLELGAAWLGGAPEPEPFELSPLRPHFRRLLREVLPQILTADLGDVDWHLRHRCEWCEYFDHCRAEMVAEKDVSKLSGLTAHGKRFLRRQHGVRRLADLRPMLERDDADAILEGCASLAGQRPRLQSLLAAHADGAAHTYGAIHPALPKGENVAIFVTVQREPVGHRTWLLGMLVQARQDVRRALFQEEGPARPFVVLAETADEEGTIRARFIRRLHEVLRRVDAWNQREAEWRNQLSLQIYTYSEQERVGLVQILLESLYEPELAEAAMVSLFHVQAPDLLLADEHPEEVLPHPVISLVSAAGRLVALPVDVSYTMPETLEALGGTFQYERRPLLHFPLGHGLRSDLIHRRWAGEDVDVRPLRNEGVRRLYAYRAALWALRDIARDLLVSWPPKHQLLESLGVDHPRLSRLLFLARYESVLACTQLRAERCEARAALAAKGKLVELVAQSELRFSVVAPTSEIEAGDFTQWLVIRDTPEGLRAQACYNDYGLRRNPWGGRRDRLVGVAKIVDARTDALGYPTALTASWTRALTEMPRPEERFLLLPRFADWNTDDLINVLAGLDGEEGLFLGLLDEPSSASTRLTSDSALSAALDRQLSRLVFTESQAAAWDTVSRQRVTAVWGPPGTGKTYFLAALILGFARAHREVGRPFRVLATAMTHAAIENLLRKLRALGDRDLALAKADGWRTGGRCDAEEVHKEDVPAWFVENPVGVVGATAWVFKKHRDAVAPHMVVIDEASQLKVPEAALTIDLVGEGGRLVAAGDHCQLGPIIAGSYPEPPEGEPILHGSVFDLLLDRPGRPGVPCQQLLENFRMNDVLTEVAARTLYGPGFRCATDAVAARRLSLDRIPAGVIGACLDPSYPLVLVMSEGVGAARANEGEAALVAQLAVAIREAMPGVEDDQAFFANRLFVVSPHHVQIRAIRRAFAEAREWTARPFIGTVDKMQGQEADVVIVSYGVADPEYAAQEADFIYSRNRLNVAITRARTKSIVCLPRPLVEASPEILDHPTAAAGLAYMRELVDLCRRRGEARRYELADGEGIELLRLGGS